MNSIPVILSIAGTDPSGGAGLLADVRTASALGVYAMGVVSAITVQNTLGVRGFKATDSDLLGNQLRAVLDDITPDAVKIGMLPDATGVETVARILAEYGVGNIVVDPVCVATSGDTLSEESALSASISTLMPLAGLITPNLPEAEAITGLKIHDSNDAAQAGKRIMELTGCPAILVKGGHFVNAGHTAVDILVLRGSNEPLPILHPLIDTSNTHGTGCTLSSAIASYLALGESLTSSVTKAVDWLSGAIDSGVANSVGHGHGPVDHLYKIRQK